MAEAPRHAITEPWRDLALPAVVRVADPMSRMTVAEKIGQLGPFWAESAAPGEQVAPAPDDFGHPPPLEDLLADGLGRLTRVFGSAPVTPADGAVPLREPKQRVAAGIPPIAHEECLTRLMTWTATLFPTPLAWGATFDQDLVEEVACVMVHAGRGSFTGRDLRSTGEIGVAVGRSSADLPLRGSVTLEGPVRELGTGRVLTVPVEVTPC